MNFAIGTISVGDVLDRGLKLLITRLPLVYAINLFVFLPLIPIELAYPFVTSERRTTSSGFESAAGPVSLRMGYWFLTFLLILLTQPLAAGAILYVVRQEYEVKRATFRGALAFAFSRFGSLLGSSLVVTLVVALMTICLVLPGAYFLVAFSFVPFTVLQERRGLSSALWRSPELSNNYFFRISLVYLAVALAVVVVWVTLAFFLSEFFPTQIVIPSDRADVHRLNLTNHVIVTTVIALTHVLFLTYFTICTAMMYFDTRVRDEGYDIERAAQLEEWAAPRRDVHRNRYRVRQRYYDNDRDDDCDDDRDRYRDDDRDRDSSRDRYRTRRRYDDDRDRDRDDRGRTRRRYDDDRDDDRDPRRDRDRDRRERYEEW
jgi:hypothetical protein